MGALVEKRVWLSWLLVLKICFEKLATMLLGTNFDREEETLENIFQLSVFIVKALYICDPFRGHSMLFQPPSHIDHLGLCSKIYY